LLQQGISSLSITGGTPTSKADSLRVLQEVGVAAASYATVKRRLPMYATSSWRQQRAAACAAHSGLGRASLVLYDVSTLYFETDAGDGFREPGFSKERRICRGGAATVQDRAGRHVIRGFGMPVGAQRPGARNAP
jgi:hypothetical protein